MADQTSEDIIKIEYGSTISKSVDLSLKHVRLTDLLKSLITFATPTIREPLSEVQSNYINLHNLCIKAATVLSTVLYTKCKILIQADKRPDLQLKVIDHCLESLGGLSDLKQVNDEFIISCTNLQRTFTSTFAHSNQNYDKKMQILEEGLASLYDELDKLDFKIFEINNQARNIQNIEHCQRESEERILSEIKRLSHQIEILEEELRDVKPDIVEEKVFIFFTKQMDASNFKTARIKDNLKYFGNKRSQLEGKLKTANIKYKTMETLIEEKSKMVAKKESLLSKIENKKSELEKIKEDILVSLSAKDEFQAQDYAVLINNIMELSSAFTHFIEQIEILRVELMQAKDYVAYEISPLQSLRPLLEIVIISDLMHGPEIKSIQTQQYHKIFNAVTYVE